MDEDAKLEPSIIPDLFGLGLMGVHVPEQSGGAGGSFFMSVLAVEELSRVDASFGVFIDVQNTLVNNSIMLKLTVEDIKKWEMAATYLANTTQTNSKVLSKY